MAGRSLGLLDIPAGRSGPAPRFARFHVWKALRAIGREGPIGRQRLAAAIGLGEGSVRTIVNFLVARGLVRADEAGMRLTARGERETGAAGLSMATVNARGLCVGECDVAVLARGRAERVRDGLRQRDEAVKAGAAGATTLVFRGGRLLMPPETDLDAEYPHLARQVRAAFELREGDVIVIGSAGDLRAAEDGALAAVVEMLDER
ncbi:MAG: DUF4443 domain-containing protein [Euryarchaeota archaeon]|nr:DUF4443 domain-containing protein [Euryarchaeota archaeon]